MAVLSEEQIMLRDMAREWADHESPVSAFRRLRDAGIDGFDPDKWAAIGDMGWAGIVVGEDHGGTDFGYVSLGLVVEQLGRNLVATPLLSTALAATAIRLGDADAAKDLWLPRLASGAAVGALAIAESPVTDTPPLSVVRDGRFQGAKTFVADAAAADLFVVSAQDGLYLVEKGAGISLAQRKLVDGRDYAALQFEGANATRLGGTELTATIMDHAAALTAAEMLGMAQSAFEQTLAYLKQRVQFGQVLSTFQALQHRMAWMFTELELMRTAVEAGLEAIDEGHGDIGQAVSLAKALAGDTLNLISREMIQLFGGVGMTDEYDAGLYLKRAAVLEAAWGNASYHRDRFGRLGGY
ncbi:MAG: acyl-CoA dehydrogenase family protein [Niveispirillum sp.]|uniref:acyl-CoA dehydrogenase family protein n=1 Tax=Niveispirillum sp. TaxID=1917217 RepID=UPI00403520C2